MMGDVGAEGQAGELARDAEERRLSRRGFLRLASLAGAGVVLAGLAACGGGDDDDDEDEDEDED